MSICAVRFWHAPRGHRLSIAKSKRIEGKRSADGGSSLVIPLAGQFRRALKSPPAMVEAGHRGSVPHRIKSSSSKATRLQQAAMYELARARCLERRLFPLFFFLLGPRRPRCMWAPMKGIAVRPLQKPAGMIRCFESPLLRTVVRNEKCRITVFASFRPLEKILDHVALSRVGHFFAQRS